MSATSLLLPLVLASTDALAHSASRPDGQVLVINSSGGMMNVDLPGSTSRILAPGQRTTFSTRPGETVVRATYEQFGATRVLEAERTVVRPNRTSVVVLDREDDTRILVTNRTREPADVRVDGRTVAFLGVGESEVVALDVGPAAIDLFAPDGRRIGHEHVSALAFAEQRVVFDAPRQGTLFVDSDHFEATTIRIDGRVVGTIAAYGERRFVVDPGTYRIAATDREGRIVEDTWVTVRPDRTTEVEVELGGRDAVASVEWNDDRDVEQGPHCHLD